MVLRKIRLFPFVMIIFTLILSACAQSDETIVRNELKTESQTSAPESKPSHQQTLVWDLVKGSSEGIQLSIEKVTPLSSLSTQNYSVSSVKVSKTEVDSVQLVNQSKVGPLADEKVTFIASLIENAMKQAKLSKEMCKKVDGQLVMDVEGKWQSKTETVMPEQYTISITKDAKLTTYTLNISEQDHKILRFEPSISCGEFVITNKDFFSLKEAILTNLSVK